MNGIEWLWLGTGAVVIAAGTVIYRMLGKAIEAMRIKEENERDGMGDENED